MARARSAPRKHFRRRLSERCERSERSEFCAGPWTRAPQGSRPAGPTASVARRAPPGQPFAATALNAPDCVRVSNVSNGPQANIPSVSCVKLSRVKPRVEPRVKPHAQRNG